MALVSYRITANLCLTSSSPRFTSSFGGRDYRQQNKPKSQQNYTHYGGGPPSFNPMAGQYNNYGGSYGGSYNAPQANNTTDWWGN